MYALSAILLALAAGLAGATPPTATPPVATAPAAATPLPDLAALDECSDSLDIAIFNTPRVAHTRTSLRVLVVSEQDLPGARLVALDPRGDVVEVAAKKFGGPPWGWVAEIPRPRKGTWRVGIGRDGRVDACQKVRVRKGRWGRDEVPDGLEKVWRSRIKWERDTENLYSLWIEHLFDAPLAEDVSWNPLHEVLRNRKRNLLHGHLGLGEDRSGAKALKYKPDCADFPYFLRAYFAWKLGLPFAFRGCTRGTARRPPRCGEIMSNHLTPDPEYTRHTTAFEWFVRRKVAGTVHSSTLRALPRSEASDFYPVKLTRKSLRPGTIYADPYGHTLMIGKWLPQQGDKAGVLLAIDAQPDGTIGRRVFWKGSFLFPNDDAVKGAGWKRFRPARITRDGLREMPNAWILKSVDYGDYSLEQWAHGQEGFYEKMDELITPDPVSPEVALEALVDALDQQVRRRVESVDNGEQWKRDHPGRTMKMPEGAAIFVTAGPWEAYSTPARDLRLLIAMDVVRAFPARVQKRAHRFKMPAGVDTAAVKQRLAALIDKLARERKYEYVRSDGSKWSLTLADVMARGVGFEMAYNPNDCVEVRWAAAEGSAERATCQRRAPGSHHRRMETYRRWFVARQRPLN